MHGKCWHWNYCPGKQRKKIVKCLVGSTIATPYPLTVGGTEAAVHIVGIAHQRIVFTGQWSILGSRSPVFTRQSSTGIDGISYRKVGTVVVATVARQLAAGISVDGDIEIGVYLLINLCQG